MVHLEEGNNKQQSTSKYNCATEDCHDELAKKEKQIGRILLIAEKDKREAMFSLDIIKKLKDQLYALSHDFHFDIAPDEVTFEFVLPPTLTLDRRRNSLPVIMHSGPNNQPITHNQSNSLACSTPLSTPPSSLASNALHPANHPCTIGEQQEVRGGVASGGLLQKLANKEEELQRVASRAQQEAAKASFLRRKKEELQHRVVAEFNKRKHFIKEMKQSIEHKEKEIARLSFLAEQDKKTGMFLCQQIAYLKKSLEGFLQAREESKPETLCNILAQCSSSNDLFESPPTSPVYSVLSSHFPTLKCTAIGKETELLLQEDEKKSQELHRVKQIVDQECRCVQVLKAKVEALKQGLVAELQQADEQLGLKMQEFRLKQLAIEKVAARAERERARSYFLNEAILKLTSALGAETGKCSAAAAAAAKRKGKNEEYCPDIAYLSSFSELPELGESSKTQNPASNHTGGSISAEVTVHNTHGCTLGPTEESAVLSSSGDAPSSSDCHATSLPLSIANLQARDPTMYIFSPPCRTIPISPASECMYAQKLKDIAVLKRETSKKEEELVRLKKLAEAERCRHLLLKDKFEQLRTEMREREAYGACTF